MDKRQVEQNEESMFREYIRNIKEEHSGTELSYFEMNLEVHADKHTCQLNKSVVLRSLKPTQIFI